MAIFTKDEPSLTDLAERKGEAVARVAKINGQRRERERRLDDLRARLRDLRREQATEALLPGDEADPRSEELQEEIRSAEEEIRRLEAERDEAVAEREAAEAALRSRVEEDFPGAVERVLRAIDGQKQALHDLGADLLDQYEDVADAYEDRSAADEELDRLRRLLTGDDPALVNEQIRRVKRRIKNAEADLTAEAVVALVVRDVVRWRSRSDELADAYEERGIERLGGSILTADAIPAVDDLATRIATDRPIPLN